MGETRVDLEHLLEDLRDAYPAGLEETILTEIIANSLDSGASRIVMMADPAQSTLAVVDNGSGMQRKAMRQYHDIASSTKVRGQGIASAMLPGQGRSRTSMRYGLAIQFEDRSDDSELGRLVESTVWINQAHPAYQRTLASRSVGYHISLTVALALAPLAVAPDQEHIFLTKFLAHWGQAIEQTQGRRRRSR